MDTGDLNSGSGHPEFLSLESRVSAIEKWIENVKLAVVNPKEK